MKVLSFLIRSGSLILLGALSGFAQQPIITTYAGSVFPANGSSAVTQNIGVPLAVSADGSGGVFIASNQNRIYHITSDGVLNVVAGNGTVGAAGDNGPATSAQLNYVQGVAADAAGNVYISDSKNNRIRKAVPGGGISTFAGTGSWGFSGDGGPAPAAHLSGPRGLAVDASGSLFIADTDSNVIRRVTPDGVISTIAGNGTAGFSGDGGSATAAQLNTPVAVSVDAAGDVLISDQRNNRIRMVTPAGIITTVAGSTPGLSGDGGLASSAQLNTPGGVAVDRAGNIFIADTGNNRVRMVDAAGAIKTVAGTGAAGFSGDNGPATSAQFVLPVDVAVDSAGNLFIADRGNYRIRRVTAAGNISSVAGISDDGHPASMAQLYFPNTLVVDGAGNVFIADTDAHRIRKITSGGMTITVAGNGTPGFSGDGGSATSAQLYYPAGVGVDGAGNLFIADTRNERIRKVTPDGIISTVAGNGNTAFGADGGLAVRTAVDEPQGVAIDGAGDIFIAETVGNRIRKVDPSGVISTVAGNGTMGFSGDGGPAVSAQLAYPTNVAVDAAGNLFIADSLNNRIRMVASNGIISTVAGNGTYGFAGDGGPAAAAEIAYPQGVSVDGAGVLFIADTNNERIRKITPDGVITTAAGNGTYGFAGDGGAASSAQIAAPYSVAVGGINSLFIADTFSNRIREVISPIVPFTIADSGGTSLSSSGNPASVQTSYALIVPGSGGTSPAGLAIYSYRPGNYLLSETGVPAVAPLTVGRIDAEVNGPVETGLAIANPNNQTAHINFLFTDAQGNNLGSGTTTVAANQQIARFLNNDPFNGPPIFQGTFTFISDVPVAATAIRGVLNERSDFLMSTLPVIDLSSPLGSGPLTVPHFSDGGGWTTQILLLNPTDAAMSGHLEFHDDSGALATVSVGGQTNKIFSYAVPPRSSYKLATDGAASVTTAGSVRILPSDGETAPVPLVVFSYKPGGTVTVTQAGVPTTIGSAFRIYVESSGNSGKPGTIESGVALANDDPVSSAVTLQLTNLDGTSTGLPGAVSVTLPGLGHMAQFLTQLFPGLPTPFKGILHVSTMGSGLSAIGLRTRYNERSDFLITTTPPANESAAQNATALVLPHLPDGGGYTSQVIVFSGYPGQSPTGSLILFQQSGQPSAVRLK